MAPLTELSKGKKSQPIKWMQEHEDAFWAIKKVITQDTILAYPDWSKPFIVHTDASDKQIGAVIVSLSNPELRLVRPRTTIRATSNPNGRIIFRVNRTVNQIVNQIVNR